MSQKDVFITIQVKLSVPSDGEYDQESYFIPIKEVLENADIWMDVESGHVFDEVDSMEVTHVTPRSRSGS